VVAHVKTPYISPQEYLEYEASTETKSEYYDGVIVAMSGASPEHNRATVNIVAGLHAQLVGKSCEPFMSDMRVRVPACNRYYYPDASVVCGAAEFELIAGVRTLLNPALIVEVLSESTESMDIGDKWLCYQTLPSLKTYLIVAQNRPLIQCYERQEDNSWLYRVYEGLEATVPLPSIGCNLRLADVYARVEFPQPAEDEQTPA
jgi:Uma2 family endonuclease